MRLIDKDRLLKAIDGYEQVCRDTNIKPTLYGIESLIYDAPTIDQWHYPSRGEYPTEAGQYFCRVRNSYGDSWYEVVLFVADWVLKADEQVIRWQYIIPPKEEA